MGQAEEAKLGDEIIFNGEVIGIVEKVNENSVIVKIKTNNTDEEYMGGKTVVSHKNYKIL